jgi:hypothetical protein
MEGLVRAREQVESVREDAQRTVRLRIGNSLDLSQLPIRCERLKTPSNATREQFARVIGGSYFDGPIDVSEGRRQRGISETQGCRNKGRSLIPG